MQIMHTGEIIQIMQIMQTARLRGEKRTGLTAKAAAATGGPHHQKDLPVPQPGEGRFLPLDKSVLIDYNVLNQ